MKRSGELKHPQYKDLLSDRNIHQKIPHTPARKKGKRILQTGDRDQQHELSVFQMSPISLRTIVLWTMARCSKPLMSHIAGTAAFHTTWTFSYFLSSHSFPYLSPLLYFPLCRLYIVPVGPQLISDLHSSNTLIGAGEISWCSTLVTHEISHTAL